MSARVCCQPPILITFAKVNQPDPMPLACPDCAAQMPETAAFCPACGGAVAPQPRAQGKVGGLAENIAGALAYFTFIPAIIFLWREPYNKNGFVRFHSVQCLVVWAAAAPAAALLRLATVFLFMIPVAGPLAVVLLTGLSGLAAFVIWLVLVAKALQGEWFRLPLLGNLAARYAGQV